MDDVASAETAANVERRVLVLTPTGQDARLTRAVLTRNGVSCEICENWECLFRDLEHGCGAVLLAEEALLSGAVSEFMRHIAAQPPWSDLPVLILTARGADSAIVATALRSLANVTLLERPIRVAALLSATRTALRARERQYQIRAHMSELERATQALRASEAQLREADLRKDEFLATLAHELRNPLAPIRNSLQVLRLTGETDATLKRVREIMDRQLNLLVRLVDDLLEVSRITRGKIEMHLERVDMGSVIRSAVETSRPVIDAGGHALSVNIAPDLPATTGDPMRLAQVFSNLLNNAAKYTDDGGRIELTARRVAGYIEVTVADSGIGIAPDMLPRVFEMFVQVRRSTSRAQGGLGVGLTLVKSLVERHQGTVEAHSEGLGRGSRFIVRLPITLPAADAETRLADVPHTALLQHRRALVVDDNHDSADSLAMLLRLMGAEVRAVYGGHDALEGLAAYSPAVMFVDIGMPEIDGYAVARRVRRHPSCNGVLLIALTGWGQEEDRRRSQEAGFDHHLVKPASLDALEEVLRAALGGSQARSAAR
jgi:signal transduction histidine kinase/ActR/RegA family two-component response regulator